MKTNKIDKVIIALDGMDKDELFKFLKLVAPHFSYVKIGMELFYAYGVDLVNKIHDEFNLNIFLDLKLHDIPNTVSSSIKSLKNLPISFLTIHISGGLDMLKAAKESAKIHLPNTKLLGVGLLTSINPQDLKLIWGIDPLQFDNTFSNLIKLNTQAGIDGLILSMHELRLVESSSLLKVCPGIRFSDEITNNFTQDQKRIGTPHDAIKNGADYLVMGRSLTQSKDLMKRVQELAHLK